MKGTKAGTGNSETLEKGLELIDGFATELEIPECVREAADKMYQTAVEEGLLQGQSVRTIAPATLYTACRRMDIPRSTADFQRVTGLDDGKVEGGYRTLSKELELEIEPVPPTLFVARYCTELNLPEEVENFANDLVEVAVGENLHSGRSPTAIAAGAIYAATQICGRDLTQETLAEETDVSTVAIRNRYQEIHEAYQE